MSKSNGSNHDKTLAKRPGGRPPTWTTQHVETILDRVASGELLIRICDEPNQPNYKTVMNWVLGFDPCPLPAFSDLYAQARRKQHERWGEEIITIPEEANGKDMAAVALAKLKTDARKWLLSKLRPEQYGDRLQVAQTGGGAQISIYLPAKDGDPAAGARVIDGQAQELEQPQLQHVEDSDQGN